MTLTLSDLENITGDGIVDQDELRELAEHAMVSSHPLRAEMPGIGAGAAEVLRNVGLSDGPVVAVQRVAWYMPEPQTGASEEPAANDVEFDEVAPVGISPVIASGGLARLMQAQAGPAPSPDLHDPGHSRDPSAAEPVIATWRLRVYPPSIRPSVKDREKTVGPVPANLARQSVYASSPVALRGYSPAQQSNQPGMRPVQLLKNDRVAWRRRQRISRAPQRVMMPEPLTELLFVRVAQTPAPSFAAAPAPSIAGARPRPAANAPYWDPNIRPLSGEDTRLEGPDHAWRPGFAPGARARSPMSSAALALQPGEE